MVQRQTIHYVSDLSGKDIVDSDAPTVHFGWDGTEYTIDLTADEAAKFHRAMEKYLSVATKVSKATGAKAVRKPPGTSANEVRVWGLENGVTDAGRGRIGRDLKDAYNAANPNDQYA